MDKLILQQITELLRDSKGLLSIAIRQRAKFEGWLKFELAHRIEMLGFEDVEIETKMDYKRSRPDISFMNNLDFYRVELKTCNTNWNIEGISKKGKPITSNINGIISDAKKLNSNYGIVAFVMFPLPKNDMRWKTYIERITIETGIAIDFEQNCEILEMQINKFSNCEVLVCVFMSRIFDNWF